LSDRRERTRRLIHLAFGGAAFLVPVLGRVGSIALAATAVFYNVLIAPAFGLDRGYRRSGERRLSGIGSYPIAVLLLLCVTDAHVAMGAWGVLAAADPAAAAVGRRWGSAAIPWNRQKTWIGSATALVVGTGAAWALLRYAGLSQPLAPACAAGAAGAVAESMPWGIDDNLPLAAAAASALIFMGV